MANQSILLTMQSMDSHAFWRVAALLDLPEGVQLVAHTYSCEHDEVWIDVATRDGKHVVLKDRAHQFPSQMLRAKILALA